eukprot:1185329-Prorocentrum_minimum.AAC.1
MRGTNIQNASYQRCEHPGFPGASSASTGGPQGVLPWATPSNPIDSGVCRGSVAGLLRVRSRFVVGPLGVRVQEAYEGTHDNLEAALVAGVGGDLHHGPYVLHARDDGLHDHHLPNVLRLDRAQLHRLLLHGRREPHLVPPGQRGGHHVRGVRRRVRLLARSLRRELRLLQLLRALRRQIREANAKFEG